jgi:hypothetical protein
MITYEDHLDYLVGMIKLKLWFAYHYKDLFPEESFANIISKRTMLLAYTALNDDILYSPATPNNMPLWHDILDGLTQLKSNHKDYLTFESLAMELFLGNIEGRIANDLERIGWMAAEEYKEANPFKYDMKGPEEH